MNKLICGDCLKVMELMTLNGERFTCVIADPPDNIGLKYESYNDKMTSVQYLNMIRSFLLRATKLSDIVWLSYNVKWLWDMGVVINSMFGHGDEWHAKPFVQTFTFGQNQNRDCGNGHRPLLRLMKKGTKLYPDAIRVPSWRQLNGDKRAAVGGRVPLDVWEVPRVTGNSKQRRGHHPTQLHEGLVRRMIDFSTKPGDSILDCFSGTGTVLRCTDDRDVTSIELDPYYCEKIAEEHGLTPNECKTRWSN